MIRVFILLTLVGAVLSEEGSRPDLQIKLNPKLVQRDCYFDEVGFLDPTACTEVFDDGRSVPHGTNCTFAPREDDEPPATLPKISQLTRLNGHWSGTDFSVGNPREINKRFFWIFIPVVVCLIFCRSRRSPRVVTKYPPEFPEPCAPKDVEGNYFLPPGQTTMKISWTKPKATDRDSGSPTVTQVMGVANGGNFDGSLSGKTHQITYRAKDRDGLKGYCYFSFTVTEKSCPAPPWPTNGFRNCDDFRVGSQCRYQCLTGYRLIGDGVVTCLAKETPGWSNVPTCEKITCDTPNPPRNGTIDCIDTTYSYQSVCGIRCNDGYSLEGPLYTQCQEDGTWSNLEAASCIDTSPPILTCKTPQIFYADRGYSSTAVNWEVPTARDNTDPTPVVTKTSGPSLGDIIATGSDYVTYVATDFDNNESPECTIEIRVEEIACGHPMDTLADDYMTFSCSGVKYTYGVECRLSCLANLPLDGTDLITCEDNSSAIGIWDWGNGTKPYCEEISCPELDPPINGALAYDTVLTRPMYTMMCNEEYDIPDMGSNFNGIFICADTGLWNPSSTVPDCIVPRNPRFLRLPGEIFYYGGECGSAESLAEIEANYRAILQENPIFAHVCPAGHTCNVENIVILCGPIGSRKKRGTLSKTSAIDQHRIARDADKQRGIIHHNMQKRQAESHLLAAYLDIVISIVLADGEKIYSKIDYYDGLFEDSLKPVIQDLIDNGTLAITGYTTKSDSWQTKPYADIECQAGYILDGEVCKPCPAGHFLNETTSVCTLCPVGEYMDNEGGAACISCPVLHSTKQEGSKHLDDCIELCGPGSVSPDGMKPCSACLYGEYQDGVGMTTCKQCPRGTTTEFTNSTSIQDCVGYDVAIERTNGPVTLASVDININDMTFMFWIKQDKVEPMSTILQLKGNGEDTFILYLTDNFGINIPDQLDKTLEGFKTDVWVHIAVVMATGSDNLDVFINGDRKFTSTVSRSSPLISNIELIELLLTATGDTGIYLTGLHLLDRALTDAEVSTHASSCHVFVDDDVIDMSIFEGINENAISLIVASNCDAEDGCDPNPCNGHVCIDRLGIFICQCGSGWTGATCDTPPDFCINHGCQNEATCNSDGSGYTCECKPGYTGELCDNAPVDGGWSPWVITTTCSQNCGSGTQTRVRECNNPAPDQYGADCIGESTETISCNTDPCEVCEDMPRQYGTLTNCSTNLVTGSRQCTLYCVDGSIIPTGLGEDRQTYNCGPETNYEWESSEALPSCIRPERPDGLELETGVDIDTEVPDEDETEFIDNISENLESSPCAGTCNTEVDLSNQSKRRRKRNTGTTLTIRFSFNLTAGTDLDFESYIINGTVSGPLQEVFDAVNTLERTAQYLQNHTADVFTTTVNGVTYTADADSLTFEGIVSCRSGSIPVDGICLECPAGSFSDGDFCSFCEKGTYQPSSGETSCIACPSTWTTETIGATNLSQCSEPATSNEPAEKYDKSKADKKVVIAIVLSSIAVAAALAALALVLYKKFKPTRRVSGPHTDRPPSRKSSALLSIQYVREITNRRYSVHPLSTDEISFDSRGNWDADTGSLNDSHDLIVSLAPRSDLPPPYTE